MEKALDMGKSEIINECILIYKVQLRVDIFDLRFQIFVGDDCYMICLKILPPPIIEVVLLIFI